MRLEDMEHEDRRLVAGILAEQAGDQNNPQRFLTDLLSQAGIPQLWIRDRQGQWSGNTNADAFSLVQWAIKQGTNPERREYTTLGCILKEMLGMVGEEKAQALAIRIVYYRLYRDEQLLSELAQYYRIPQPILAIDTTASDKGPDFVWYGPQDEVELQSFLQSEPSGFVDMGLMIRATEHRNSICRIEIPTPSGLCYGTGFLVRPSLVLTSYHVIADSDSNDVHANAQKATLCFDYITGSKGQEFKLDAEQPVLEKSPIDLLDYALLKVEDRIKDFDQATTVPYELSPPVKKTGLHILQHPEGKVLQLGFSENGITGVYQDKHRIQYVTRTLGGSSGSPCFNDDWKVVALHRAQRNKGFGSIREGILFSAIYDEIRNHLN
ncbi:trypsin-like serine peptidase [Nodosilinea sp. AN01ver1]|uniref:trypsin-like serine peptidase n=1 Tax=Nodosilinea sp. AN01ver1 TaxID=3423362 RepID=UPI003D315D76